MAAGSAEAQEPSQSAVSLQDVWVSLGGRWVLQSINLEIAPREYMAVIGPNGSGKSTLLRVLLGLVRVRRGRVAVLGHPPKQAHGRIGYVPQHAHFDADFPIQVVDVVRLGRLRRTVCRPGHRQRERNHARRALARTGVEHLAARSIGELSGGELQRVLIARALANEPEVLLMDEPTAALDAQGAESFYRLLEGLAESMTVIMVTHDVGAISPSVQRVVCLNRTAAVHAAGALDAGVLEELYGCPVDVFAHGARHLASNREQALEVQHSSQGETRSSAMAAATQPTAPRGARRHWPTEGETP